MNPSDTTPSSAQPPRLVEHPGRRRAWRAGQRNLAWGTAFFCATLCVLGIGIFSGGPRAALPLVLCIVVFTALWVLARMKVFSQRNGVFFALAVTALVGSGAGLIEQAWSHLMGMRRSEPALPNVTIAQPREGSVMPVGSGSAELPYLVEALELGSPAPTLPRVRATKDFTVQVGPKTYRVRRGDTFLFADEKPGKYIISANEVLAEVPQGSTEMLMAERVQDEAPQRAAAAPEVLTNNEKAVRAALTEKSKKEAARRYPGLARAGSAENALFIEAYTDLKRRNSQMLNNPEWPMELAETLARRLGWDEAAPEEDVANMFGDGSVVEPDLAPGTRMLAPQRAEAVNPGVVPEIDPAPTPLPKDNPLLPETPEPPPAPPADGPLPPPPTPQ